MSTSNRVAIFIRGFERTWDWVKNNNFKVFESIYGTNIDWYVATWSTSNTDRNKLLNDFNNKNLKCLQILDEVQYPFNKAIRSVWSPSVYKNWKNKLDNYWRLAYLDFVLGNEKVKNEIQHNMTYDTVVFTRFDLLHQCKNIEYEKSLIMPMFFISTVADDIEDLDYSLSYDVYYKSDSLTADIITSRFFDTYISDFKTQAVALSAEVLFANYLFRNGIIGKDGEEFNFISHLIRPNQCYDVELTPDIIDPDLSVAWLHSSPHQKIKECIRCNIDPNEYVVI